MFNKVQKRGRKSTSAFAGALLLTSCLTGMAVAQDDDEIIVRGSLRALPVEDVGSVYGFDKNLTEIPRSASTVSAEQLERFGITDVYGLVSQSPGTFTSSFFGVAGALDIRGTPGEVYFRGVRRLDNPGNYPQPLGATDRIDIVRGPASPIYGPSKIGGYINFVPKTARVDSGEFLSEPEGQLSYTRGRWDKNVVAGNVTGPLKLFGQDIGYNLYAEIEDSGSFYRNIATNQTVVQASFETDLTDRLTLEFGGMYHDFDGDQNGGWNRLTNDLIATGTYITGVAQPLDTNGDGAIDAAEAGAVTLSPFGVPASSFTDADFIGTPLPLTNVGTAILGRDQVLTGPEDVLQNEAVTLYMDFIFDAGNGWEIKNQLFFDGFDNLNENAYGFSQFHDSSVIEDKIVITKESEFDFGRVDLQFSPSIRHTEFVHGDDFFFEYFHRVDLTDPNPYTALSRRLLSTQCDCDYANYVSGSYTNYAVAGLANMEFVFDDSGDKPFGLDLVLGARYDWLDGEATDDDSRLVFGTGADVTASDHDGGFSWNASAVIKTPFGLNPYVTAAEQLTIIAGQGAEVSTGNLAAGTWTDTSELFEYGVKGSFLDDTLFISFSRYDQSRTDFNVQSITVNQSVETEGMEAEVRWAPTDALLVTAGYTKTEVVNTTVLNAGSQFSFLGAEDLVNVSDPSLTFGGQPFGLILVSDEEGAKRAGIPENIYSANATYSFENGLAFNASVIHVDDTPSGQSRVVNLPSYTLLDLGATYELDNWLFRAVVKNVTNETYYRANFTELFGSTIVLPEEPRSFEATVIYKF